MPDKQATDLYLESIAAWHKNLVTIGVIQILKALKYQTQQSYVQAQSQEQFEYLRGLEIGYDRAIQVITEEIKNPVRIEMEQVPVIIKE